MTDFTEYDYQWRSYQIKLEVAQKLDESVIQHMLSNFSQFAKSVIVHKEEEGTTLHKGNIEPLAALLMDKLKEKSFFALEFTTLCKAEGKEEPATLFWFVNQVTDARFSCSLSVRFKHPWGAYHHTISFPLSIDDDAVKAKDYRWYVTLLLKITAPYTIKKVRMVTDTGVSNITPYKPLVVVGHFARGTLFYPYDPSRRNDIWKARIQRALDRILTNIREFGGEVAPVDTNELAAGPFPICFRCDTKFGKVKIVLEKITALFDYARGPVPDLADSLTIVPDEQVQTTDLRPYLELLNYLGRGLGFEDIVGLAD